MFGAATGSRRSGVKAGGCVLARAGVSNSNWTRPTLMHLVSSPFLPSLVQPAKGKLLWRASNFLTSVAGCAEHRGEWCGATWGATSPSQGLVRGRGFCPKLEGQDGALCHRQHRGLCCVCSRVSVPGWSYVTELRGQESVRALTVWTARTVQPFLAQVCIHPAGRLAPADMPRRISAGTAS